MGRDLNPVEQNWVDSKWNCPTEMKQNEEESLAMNLCLSLLHFYLWNYDLWLNYIHVVRIMNVEFNWQTVNFFRKMFE